MCPLDLSLQSEWCIPVVFQFWQLFLFKWILLVSFFQQFIPGNAINWEFTMRTVLVDDEHTVLLWHCTDVIFRANCGSAEMLSAIPLPHSHTSILTNQKIHLRAQVMVFLDFNLKVYWWCNLIGIANDQRYDQFEYPLCLFKVAWFTLISESIFETKSV